jgi:hypothetical protein
MIKLRFSGSATASPPHVLIEMAAPATGGATGGGGAATDVNIHLNQHRNQHPPTLLAMKRLRY